ncbi:MAG TPA: ankyrin repeat domain-containing protein [Sedimentisphaerales bacterium]|nr:ankyrin repeat domain-containing protein [Sedimentisphaerales bacterium]
MCASLISAGCSDNGKSKEAARLIQAAKDGDVQAVKALLAGGANVNIKDDNGRVPLMWAAYNGHTSIVQLLEEAGAKE